MTDHQKLAAIRRVAQQHATPAVNIGAHRLAGLILEIIDGSKRIPSETQRSRGR